MSSLYHNLNRAGSLVLVAALLMLLFTPAIGKAQSAPGSDLPVAQAVPPAVPTSDILPGSGAPPPPDPLVAKYEGNPQVINDGHRLFNWYNCVGCHANGGGGMGPALMDNQWRYGGQLDQIFSSIYHGRPNGMPYWAGKIPNGQIWELAAFVKSLSANSSAKGGPAEVMPQPPPPVGVVPQAPVSAAPGVTTEPK